MRYALKLDTAKPEDIRTLTVRKGEFGSMTLVFEVSEEGKRIDLAAKDSEGESAYTVRFCARTGNGVVVDDVSVAEDGSASYTLPAAIGASAGMVKLAYLRIESAGAVATTQCVWFKVLDAVDMDAAREVYIPEFERLKGELDGYVQQFKGQYDAIAAAEEERASKDAGRDAKISNAEQSASIAVGAANIAKETAQSVRDDADSGKFNGAKGDPGEGVPSGGSAGQVLTKTAAGTAWQTPTQGSTSWDDIADKPSSFVPSDHTHSAGSITSGTLSSLRLPNVPVSKGGTGATTAAAALANLGVAIGTDDPPATGAAGSIYIKLEA